MSGNKLRCSICLDAVYRGVPLAEALADVRRMGFDTVECWALGKRSPEDFARLLRQEGLTLSAFCPDHFVLNDPAMLSRYLESLRKALRDAQTLGCASLITQVGQDTGEPREVQHRAIVTGLKAAAPLLEAAGVTLLVEPLNTVKDHRGYYLFDSAEAFDIIREVDSPRVKALYDIYHQLHMGEDVQAVIRENHGLIAHFHTAGFPARDERLFSGGYDYRPLLQWMAQEKLTQPVGVELFPTDAEARTRVLSALAAL